MKRITKKEARKTYNSGKRVIFCPSKCCPQSMLAVDMYKKDDIDFDNLVNHFSYYNCSNVSGKVVHFYI